MANIKFETFLNIIKTNHLEYIELRWYGNQISADWQQNLLSLKHDTSGRYLLVIFLKIGPSSTKKVLLFA